MHLHTLIYWFLSNFATQSILAGIDHISFIIQIFLGKQYLISLLKENSTH